MNIESILFAAASIMAVFMGIAAVFVRQKAAKRPLTMAKIVIPPVMMSTGALMYIFPYFRLTPFEIMEATVMGLLFSIVLVMTTRYEEKDGALYVKQSRMFPVILIVLLVLRIILKTVLSMSISPGEIGGMFFLLAFVMIVIWRLSMFIHLQAFKKQQINEVSPRS
ncbi:CcdC family protein [Salinicoccus luteus]|uniref:CcdC family protein n=1 Tax=Salinicoccus luteus TaxID=367840 RepID=UPI0004E0D2B0|nr:cytochrome c biogenesis protein CcdC [Salinicoccus luteus]